MARTLFVGDVHGCAEELDRLLRVAEPERVVLVGDLFTRGPDPRGVWKLIKRWEADAVLGNHDDWVLRNWTPGEELPRKAFKWLKSCRHILHEDHWVSVHAGINPRRGYRRTRPTEAMTLERFPRRRAQAPFWWDLYAGQRLVIHGHHSRHGLLDRRPFTLGLDTACVKGGRLTGYLLEENRLLSVPARRAWV